jgi:hypothetical protein
MPVRFDDASFGGLLDSAAQALTYDRALIEARKARQQAAIAAATAQKERATAKAQLRTVRAQTAAVKSTASQERLTAEQAARAEAARRAKAATLLSEQRLATQTEKAGTQTARAGTTRDAAEQARTLAQAGQQSQTGQSPAKQATTPSSLSLEPSPRVVPVSALSSFGADSMPANKPNILQALLPNIHIDPIRPQDWVQTPAERQAALARRTAAEQADIVRQVRNENPAVDTAMSAGKVALGVAIGTGLAAGIAALAGPMIEPAVTRTEAAKVGGASYVATIGLMLGGAAAIKAVRGSKA